MSLDRDGKLAVAIFALVAAVLLGINYMVSQDRDPNWMIWIIALLFVAVLFWLWIRNDDQAKIDAEESARKADAAAKEAAQVKVQAEARAKADADAEAAKAKMAADAKAKAEEEAKLKAEAAAKAEAEANAKAEAEAAKAKAEAEAKSRAEAEAAKVKAEAEAKSKESTQEIEAAASSAGKGDDLTRIEGIGPKYREVLSAAGLGTFAKVAAASEDRLVEVIKAAGLRKPPSVGSWAEQAALAAKGDWAGLEELQSKLTGGRKS